jgi:hypothetical protein
MRSLIWVAIILIAVANGGDGNAQSAGPFDGKWTTIVTCPLAEGAGSFDGFVAKYMGVGYPRVL